MRITLGTLIGYATRYRKRFESKFEVSDEELVTDEQKLLLDRIHKVDHRLEMMEELAGVEQKFRDLIDVEHDEIHAAITNVN